MFSGQSACLQSCLGSTNVLVSFLSSDSHELDPDLARLASLGFTGCLSVVHFNSISPLKAALLHPDTSPVTITGPLVQSNCGSSASANPYAAENTHHLSGKKRLGWLLYMKSRKQPDLLSFYLIALCHTASLLHWVTYCFITTTTQPIPHRPLCCYSEIN